MGFLSRLLGGGGGGAPPPPPTLGDVDIDAANRAATGLVAMSPEEEALLERLSRDFDDSDKRVLDEMSRLRTRGEDLSNVDAEYMRRAYEPAFQRLMNDYELADRSIMEDMNRRGIAAIPGGSSEQEAYQRSLLSRESKEAMGRNMLEAQNQAVQQKLAQYNARLAETNQANVRRQQTFEPLYEGTVTSADTRTGSKVGAAGNIYNARLGHQAQMHQINTGRKLAGQQNLMNLFGAGLGAGGTVGGAMMLMSDRNAKTNIGAGPSPEESLLDLESVPVSNWNYKSEPPGSPRHIGPMAQDMPSNVSPDGSSIDIPSYLGTLTNAVKALSAKMGAFEQLMARGGAM